ncbi:Putative porin [Alteromonadaceae bacterium Bs31]|nr:Putative porin [Alteromonadaceae bacterium Bs31]
MLIKYTILLGALVVPSLSVASEEPGGSDVPALNSRLTELLDEVKGLQQRVEELEEEKQNKTKETEVQPVVKKEKPPLKFKGDFRLRHDTISKDNQDEDRTRYRIRARAAVQAKVSDSAQVVFGLASGNDDPISTNQTLGDAASTKDWRLDLAYFDWQLADQLRWVGGKYKNTLFRPGGHFLLWDGDLRPEGLSLVSKNKTWFAELGYNFVESDNRSGKQETVEYYTTQLGSVLQLGGTQLTTGVGYYFFNTKNKGEFDTGHLFGNSLTEDGRYKYNYEELELFAEWKTQLANVPFMLFADYVQNLDAPEEDTGYALGMRWGKNKEPGDFRFSYSYQELQADAAFGLFTDSDFAGGGTDNHGHLIKGSYVVHPGVTLALSYYDTHYGEFTLGEENRFARTFIDLIFKF